MTDLDGWNSPVCMYEHAISQRRQPVHFVGVILSTLVGSAVRVAISPFLSCGALRGTVSVALETVDELIERNRGHRHARHTPARAGALRGEREVVARGGPRASSAETTRPPSASARAPDGRRPLALPQT